VVFSLSFLSNTRVHHFQPPSSDEAIFQFSRTNPTAFTIFIYIQSTVGLFEGLQTHKTYTLNNMSKTHQFSRDLSDSEDEEDSSIVYSSRNANETKIIDETPLQKNVDELQAKLQNQTISSTKKQHKKVMKPRVRKISQTENQKYAVDNLLLELLEQMDRFTDLQGSVQKRLSDGYYHLSTAKYKQTSFARAFPSTDSIRCDFDENIRLLTVKDPSVDSLEKDTDNQETENKNKPALIEIEEEEEDDNDEVCQFKIESKEKPEDYLLNFHGLPSTMMKRCQQDFLSLMEKDICELAFIKQSLVALCQRIEEQRKPPAND
jgi:molecular chaperone GrpE (heat shock protein)